MRNSESDNLLSAARAALAEGENFKAYDLASAVPDRSEGPSAEKVHVMALALARSGAGVRARELAATLPDGDDTEIMGLKSRLFKDLARVSLDSEDRWKNYALAAEVSERVFAARGNWYNGVNAASCRFLAGDRGRRSVSPYAIIGNHGRRTNPRNFGAKGRPAAFGSAQTCQRFSILRDNQHKRWAVVFPYESRLKRDERAAER